LLSLASVVQACNTHAPSSASANRRDKFFSRALFLSTWENERFTQRSALLRISSLRFGLSKKKGEVTQHNLFATSGKDKQLSAHKG